MDRGRYFKLNKQKEGKKTHRRLFSSSFHKFYSSINRTKLFTGTVPENKNYVTGTVHANKSYVIGTVKKG